MMRKFEDRIDNDYSAVVPICSVNTLCAVFLYFRVCSHNRSTQRMGPGTLASIAEPIRGFGDNELRGQLSTPHQSTLTPSPRVANSCRARLTRIGRDSARRNQNIGEINTRFHHVSVCGRGMSHYVDAASHLRAAGDSIFVIAIRVSRACARRILNNRTELAACRRWPTISVAVTIAPHAEKCVALAIGNKDCRTSVGALVNSLNSVRRVARRHGDSNGKRDVLVLRGDEDADALRRTIRTSRAHRRAKGEFRSTRRDRKSEATHGAVSTHSNCWQLSASLRHDAAILRKTSCASTSPTQ